MLKNDQIPFFSCILFTRFTRLSKHSIHSVFYVIIAITESHINEHYLKSEVHIHGYTRYRADREAGTRKGGIIVYIRNDQSPGLKTLTFGSVGKIEYLYCFTSRVPKASLCNSYRLVIDHQYQKKNILKL